jgi:hypothetical protein
MSVIPKISHYFGYRCFRLNPMYDMHKKAIEKREIIDYLILELGFELRVSHLLGSHFTT